MTSSGSFSRIELHLRNKGVMCLISKENFSKSNSFSSFNNVSLIIEILLRF